MVLVRQTELIKVAIETLKSKNNIPDNLNDIQIGVYIDHLDLIAIVDYLDCSDYRLSKLIKGSSFYYSVKEKFIVFPSLVS